MKGDEDSMERARFLDNVDVPKKLWIDEEPASRRRRLAPTTIVLHGSLIAFYTMMFIFLTYKDRYNTINYEAFRVPSPAWESISYEKKYFVNHKTAARKYFGEPNEEREALWEDLLAHSTIRLTPEELKTLEKPEGKTVQLPDGDYVGVLNVFHDLHCLRRVGRMLYPDHYWPNITSEEKQQNIMHSAHCLDRLRQAIQCQADISIVTFSWGKRTTVPLGNLTAQHECVNWDSLRAWTQDRSIDPFEPGLLTHPTLGPAYAELDPDRASTGFLGDEPL